MPIKHQALKADYLISASYHIHDLRQVTYPFSHRVVAPMYIKCLEQGLVLNKHTINVIDFNYIIIIFMGKSTLP